MFENLKKNPRSFKIMKKNVANPVSYIQDNLSKETSCDHMRQSSNSVVIG